MNTTENEKLSPDDGLEAHREVIGRSLDGITVEMETALRDASLDVPVFLVVPSSGSSIITFATPLDPSEEDWDRASAIVCRVVGEKLGGIKLGCRPLQCSVANSKFAVANVIRNPE